MRALPIILTFPLILGACQLAGPAGTASSGAKRVGTAAAASPRPASAAPTTAPPTLGAVGNGALTKANKDTLILSLRNALAATRASRMSATLNEASGIIANNGGGVLSDNGLGLVSNNGGGVLSDNGLGYRVAAAGDVDYTSETADLVYHFTYKNFSAPAPRNGTMRIYEKAGYLSTVPGDREKALLDHFTWADMGVELGYGGVPLHAAISFPMTKVTSKRLAFADKMLTRRIVRLKSLTALSGMTDIGWEYEFSLAINWLAGENETATFKAIAGEADLMKVPTSRGSEQSLPAKLAVTGKNATGTYVGEADNTQHRADIVHTTADGVKTRVVFLNPPGGKGRLEVESLATGFTVATDLHAEGGGEGELRVAGSKAGSVRYDAAGLATITFKDGSTTQAQLF